MWNVWYTLVQNGYPVLFSFSSDSRLLHMIMVRSDFILKHWLFHKIMKFLQYVN